ncbi:histidine phosphatase family protein [Abyssisolibacter fermentans]|uniref:histidine phosphatase family protein n=1 Tax=Abyssisolibacter fermentans TaxID=1766203 RepID=UPI00082C9A6B|nr:histidine phosphatase family protein [Abyssisolibacter fermentans]
MAKIFLTRHGQTMWNIEGRLQGHKDSNLTALGEQQAKWLGNKLKDEKIDIIISSSSNRTLRTAEFIRGNRNIELIPNDNFREINMGKWQGMLNEDIEKQYPEEKHNFWHSPHLYKPHGGETFGEVLTRASMEIENIIKEYEGKNILVVTHTVTLKAIITYYEKKELKDLWTGAYMHPTCLNILEVNGNDRRFILQGDISHYEEN